MYTRSVVVNLQLRRCRSRKEERKEKGRRGADSFREDSNARAATCRTHTVHGQHRFTCREAALHHFLGKENKNRSTRVQQTFQLAPSHILRNAARNAESHAVCSSGRRADAADVAELSHLLQKGRTFGGTSLSRP